MSDQELPPPGPPPPSAPPSTTGAEKVAAAFRRAPVTMSIIALTVAVWLLHLALQHWAGVNTDLTLADNGAGIHGDWWRLVTPMVVHFGLLHIGLNMFMLFQLGPPVEQVLGRWLYGASYIVCGIAGSVLSDVMLGNTALSGGASGAIVGVVGLLIGNSVVTARAEAAGRRSTQRWRFNPGVARALGIQMVIWIAVTSVAVSGIDNWAHIGGGIVGLAIGGVTAWGRTDSGPPPSPLPPGP